MYGNGYNYSQAMNSSAVSICKSALSKLFILLMEEEAHQTIDVLDNIEDDIHELGPCAFGAAGMMKAEVLLRESYRAELGTSAKLSTLANISVASTRFRRALANIEELG